MAPTQFPDRTELIVIHRRAALGGWASGDFDSARKAFPRLVESIRQQNINTNGGLEAALAEARSQHAQFAAEDPLCTEVMARATAIIRDHPGILQTEIYSYFPSVSREDLTYAFYFADYHGRIVRAKKGRTYEIRVPEPHL